MKLLILSSAFAASWGYALPWTQKKWPAFLVGCALVFIALIASVYVLATATPE